MGRKLDDKPALDNDLHWGFVVSAAILLNAFCRTEKELDTVAHRSDWTHIPIVVGRTNPYVATKRSDDWNSTGVNLH
jgi:hypothetical protein